MKIQRVKIFFMEIDIFHKVKKMHIIATVFMPLLGIIHPVKWLFEKGVTTKYFLTQVKNSVMNEFYFPLFNLMYSVGEISYLILKARVK